VGRWRGAWCRHVRASRWAQASDWPNSNLHHAYRQATTITFAGITACQVGTAFATRTNRAVLRTIGVFSNRLLLWGLGFDIAFAAAVIYLPPLQSVFGTASLSILDVVPLAAFRYWYGQRRTSPMGSPPACSVSKIPGLRASVLASLGNQAEQPDLRGVSGVGSSRPSVGRELEPMTGGTALGAREGRRGYLRLAVVATLGPTLTLGAQYARPCRPRL